MWIKRLLPISLFALLAGYLVGPVMAQDNRAWSQCADNREIVRCVTYDCPSGDTNNDGDCDLNDDNARLTDARNDSFCANPLSGCGVVRYYASGDNAACATRVKESGNNCNLYKASDPNFTPVPVATATSSPSPTAIPTPTPTNSPSPTPTGTVSDSDSSLPKTGPSPLGVMAIIGTGFLGIYLFEKYKLA